MTVPSHRGTKAASKSMAPATQPSFFPKGKGRILSIFEVSGRGKAGSHGPTCCLALQNTDVILLATLALFTFLAVAFPGRVTDWSTLVLKNFAVAVAYLVCATLAQRSLWKPLRFSLRLVPVALTYGYLFLATDSLQFLIFAGFQDQLIVDLEQMVLGFQPAVWLERFARPAVTEWMMFAYMFYFVMYPLLCSVIYFKHGEPEMEHFLFTLGLTNVLCDLCFILLPIGGPLTGMPDQFAVPLEGGFFTRLGELVRSNLQFPGGSLPSPHCAAATIMWAMAWRYHRRLFWLLLPLVISLYISTVFGRYHYLSDAVTGILTALLVLPVARWIERRIGNQCPDTSRGSAQTAQAN